MSASRRSQALGRSELLAHAARCYRAAGRIADAARCYEDSDDLRTAARLREDLGQMRRAAELYENVRDWAAAGRCYVSAGEPLEAARCYKEGNDALLAAWVEAHEAHRNERARATIASILPESLAEEVALGLVRARCDANGRHGSVGSAVRRASVALADLVPGYQRDRIYRWSLTLADVFDRPDLSAEFRAASVSAHIPQALTDWEQWANERLHTAAGLPEAPQPLGAENGG